jgi:UDP-N-acetyl-D-galactosamine dehydrogenase
MNFMNFNLDTAKIAIIGLGYVGLPLAVEFSKKRPTVGFDVKRERVAELWTGVDSTREVPGDELRRATNLVFSCDLKDIRDCNVYIVEVPTPIDAHKRPDFRPPDRGLADRRPGAEEKGRGRLRIYGLPGRHRGEVHSGPGDRVRDDL